MSKQKTLNKLNDLFAEELKRKPYCRIFGKIKVDVSISGCKHFDLMEWGKRDGADKCYTVEICDNCKNCFEK